MKRLMGKMEIVNMMSVVVFASCCSCASIGSNSVTSATAEAGSNEVLRVVLNLSDGSRIIGISSIDSVPLTTSYAKMNVPLRQVLTITMDADHKTAAVDLQNGDKLKGVINIGSLKLVTAFGEVLISMHNISDLRVSVSTSFSSRQGLVLWNRLSSEHEVANSRVGPGGKLNAGHFVTGRFGKGIELNMQEQFGVTFPSEIVPGPEGCIEFWAKLVGFPSEIRQPGGAAPSLIGACDVQGASTFLMFFCANDGNSNGGLCFRCAGIGGTGPMGAWSYTGALGSDMGAWHHYALVWAANGIPGVDNGKRNTAIYVDGELNTGAWTGTGSCLWLPKSSRFGLLASSGPQGGCVVFDNLKIWNQAKTDFSDRNDDASY